MKRTANPLLAILRTQPLFCPKCQRVYTYKRKDGSFKAKFYNVDTTEYNPQQICCWLESKGWKVPCVSVVTAPFGHSIVSIIFEASK